ncbi:metal-binding protein, partial [Dolichospermum sp. ST_sed3]|nr:metal-binding protein [Dolichospermum sp. ST_sed3]
MPNGRTHDLITLAVSPVVVGAAYYFTKDVKTTAIIFVLYLFSSLMFNGDLDTNSSPYNRWFILKMIWIPYQLMFGHRSIFTHGLVIGTLIRMIYVGLIPFTIFYFTSDINIISYLNIEVLTILFIGLESGSAVHTISDNLQT